MSKERTVVNEVTYSTITIAWGRMCYYYEDFNKWAMATYNLTYKELKTLKQNNLKGLDNGK